MRSKPELADVKVSAVENGASANSPVRSAGCSPGTHRPARRDLVDRDLRLGSRSSGVGDLAGSVARASSAVPRPSRIGPRRGAGAVELGGLEILPRRRQPIAPCVETSLIAGGCRLRNRDFLPPCFGAHRSVWVQTWVHQRAAPYNRTALVEQRREVMERWATFAYDTVNFST